jgi:hypothetical protein
MICCAPRSFSFLYITRSPRAARYFHRVTTDFINHDARGHLVARKVPVIVGNPGETYVLIDLGVGSALRAASPFTSASAASTHDRCKLPFFHGSQYFWFGKLSVCEIHIIGVNKSVFNPRIVELSPPLCPKPNPSSNRLKYKPCNFVPNWKDA